MNYVMNGLSGGCAELLEVHNMDPGVLRPWRGENGKSYVTLTINGKQEIIPVANAASASLRKDEWIQLDEAVIKAARQRLKLVADLRSAGLVYNIPNGMSKTELQHQTMSDPGSATMDMDGLAKSDNDRPVYELKSLPLPIVHSQFEFSARAVAVSRTGGSPIDTTMAEAAGRRVAEYLEQLAIGNNTDNRFATIYGLTNYPQRLTRTITAPTAAGWVPNDTVLDVLAMRQQSITNRFYGPWKLYHSTGWQAYLDEDYSAAKGDITLRERLMKINGITGVESLDFLTGTQLLLVQQTTDVVRMVNGMDLTTVQWESQGGLMRHFKVLCIQVPQIRCDINSRTGIVHGS